MATTTVVNREPTTNELLCFIRAKVDVMTFDSLKKLCTDYYDVAAIRKAKDILMYFIFQDIIITDMPA